MEKDRRQHALIPLRQILAKGRACQPHLPALPGTSAPFRPLPLLKGAYVQSIMASLGVRATAARAWTANGREIVFTTPKGVRLQGFFSPQQHTPGKGLVILLHGWEGSVDSTYMLTTGRHLHSRGFDILRLNYRDHGQSHHLNTGLFFATNLDEVFQSVKQAAALSRGGPVFLAGFSLGGNFALRIARQCTTEPIGNLQHIVAVSPVLDPSRATDCIDRAPLFRTYFLKKWRRSLKRKQLLFPGLYDLAPAINAGTCRAVTRAILPYHPAFISDTAYFNAYRLGPDDLADIPVPTSIITAWDDPIIPADDFHGLRLNDHTNLIIHRYGGHNGFIEGLVSGTWHERYMAGTFAAGN